MPFLLSFKNSELRSLVLTVLFSSLIGCGGGGGSGKSNNPGSSSTVSSNSSHLSVASSSIESSHSSSDSASTESSSSSSVTSNATSSYDLTYHAETGGTIAGQTNQSVKAGESGSAVTAIPAENYRFIGWSDGLLRASRTDIDIQQRTSLTARFSPAGLWSIAPYSGDMLLEVRGSDSIDVVWEADAQRTVIVSTAPTIEESLGAVKYTNASSPFKLEDLDEGRAVYVALQQDDVILAWTSGTPKSLYVDGVIHSVELTNDEKRILAGDFSHVGPVYSSLALLPGARDGKSHPLFFPDIHRVNALASDGDGGWYIGGSFNNVSGQVRHGFVHINSEGQVSSWAPAFEDEQVTNITVVEDIVYVVHEPLLMFTGNSLQLSAFKYNQTTPLFSYSLGQIGTYKVASMTATAERLYIGGAFPDIDGSSRNNLAALGFDGALLDWQPMVDYVVLGVAAVDDRIFIAKQCPRNTAWGEEPTCSQGSLAIYSQEGNEITPQTLLPGELKNIQSHGEYVYATGRSGEIPEALNPTVLRFDINGKLIPLEVTLETSDEGALLIHDDILFFSAAGQTGQGLKAYSLKEKRLLDWDIGTSSGASVIAASEKTLLTLGGPRVLGGQSRNSLAAFDRNDRLTEWSPMINGKIKSTALDGENLYIGGTFTFDSEGGLREGAASFNREGELNSWSPPVSITSTHAPEHSATTAVETIAVKNGVVYLGGKFYIQGAETYQLQHVTAHDQQGNMLNWQLQIGDPLTKVRDLAVTDMHAYLLTETQSAPDTFVRKIIIASRENPVEHKEVQLPEQVTPVSLAVENNDVYAIAFNETESQIHTLKLSSLGVEHQQPIREIFNECHYWNAGSTPTSASLIYNSRIFWGEKDICLYRGGLAEHNSHYEKVVYPGMQEVSAISANRQQLIIAGTPIEIREFSSQEDLQIYSYKVYDLNRPLDYQ